VQHYSTTACPLLLQYDSLYREIGHLTLERTCGIFICQPATRTHRYFNHFEPVLVTTICTNTNENDTCTATTCDDG